MSAPRQPPPRRIQKRKPPRYENYTPTPDDAGSSPPRSPPARPPTEPVGTRRTGIIHDVARGSIGSDYGPYSFEPALHHQGLQSPPWGNSSAPAPMPTSTHTHTRTMTSESFSSRPKPALKRANTTTLNSAAAWDKNPPLDLDDAAHNPDPLIDKYLDRTFEIFSLRGWTNFLALFAIFGGLLALFAGYPVIAHFTHPETKITGFNLGGINGSGQVPQLTNFPLLIDADTPQEAYSYTSPDGKKYDLVFSDEFNVEGRSFYAGDDPYWEAVDLHYWPTGDLEWYDPGAVTTKGGNLAITLSKADNHDLNYSSGMLQSWNKICFTTAYIEVSVSLPGSPSQVGFWPAAWTMGNLGRAGYGATTEGMWPYTYAACDLGTFPNQTTRDGQPASSFSTDSNPVNGDAPGLSMSFLPGQRLSACTCPGGDHPGPATSVGRGVPEIDIFEALVEVDQDDFRGQISQSYQVAPYNAHRQFNNASSAGTRIQNSTTTKLNKYLGNEFQQTVSALSYIDSSVYVNASGGTRFAQYGIEWSSNPDKREQGFINWYSNGARTWGITGDSIGADNESQVSERLISEEPMYLIFNLGISPSFQTPDYDNLVFPAEMLVDYVRVYQLPGTENGLTCDPPSHPTADYINRHIEAYSNPNLTTFEQAGFTFPRNSLYDGC